MQFVNSLFHREHYVLHALYSGLPSSTPSVQAELYYGTRTAVPAFGFRDHRTGRLVRMFSSDIALDVEQRISQDREGLLMGGSSYGNIYGGGAKEVHFCATSFGWGEFFKTVNPIRLLIVMLLNFWMFFRVLGLMVIEVFLAAMDFVRGILSGREFWQELLMVPARLIVVVLLRELVTIGACFDAARGLPIIHVNFLGYDEQAHRRGPKSRFAHWTLSGIDRAIKRIWKAAHRGAGREYDVWVFSDHGQEATQPYQLMNGKSIQEVVAEIVDEVTPAWAIRNRSKRLPSRARWLGVGRLVTLFFGEQDLDIQNRSENVQTVTSGPLGFVYLLNETARSRRDHLIQRLIHEADVPMIVVAENGNRARVVTREGVYFLPDDMIQVFGADHPFLEDAANDLIRLAHHVDSGDVVLVGWTRTTHSTSFVLQNGAHAGPGIDETSAFALLPPDTHFPITDKRYLRPSDLRLAAMHLLNRIPESAGGTRRHANHRGSTVDVLRIMTYNVHACVGMDGQLSPQRIARVISQTGASLVCLQELDVFRRRSGKQDQAHEIATFLEMNFQFHPAWHIEEEKFGNAVLTRFPLNVVKADSLHHYKESRSRRSAIWVEIEICFETRLQVISSHLSIYPREQLRQADELLRDWIEPAMQRGPVVLCGDLNARPNSRCYRVFASALRDVASFSGGPPKPTYFSPKPVSRLDHIFVSKDLFATHSDVIESQLARIASDHLPLVANIRVNAQQDTVAPLSPGIPSTTGTDTKTP
jgi:endonuclease/exonuclease/phosphatase family metal-dependent hydrolase